jgi:GntR family transcriptional regulator
MTDPTGEIDRFSPVPFHHQVRKLLERQIETGRWSPGDRLPSEPSLSEHYNVSRTTVRQALDTLVQQGLISKEKGRGAFVNHVSPSWLLQWAEGLSDDKLSRHGVTVESAVLKAFVERLPHWAADALELEHDAKGVTLERIRRVRGELALYVVNHLSLDYAGVIDDIQLSPTASLYSILLDRYGVKVAGSSRTLEAVAAPPLASRLLGVPKRYPLVYIQSITRDSTEKPVDCYRTWLRSDRLRIALETDSSASLAGRVVNHASVGVPTDGPSPTAWVLSARTSSPT